MHMKNGGATQWPSATGQALSTSVTDLSGTHVAAAARQALKAGLGEKECIVKLARKKAHPLAIRNAMRNEGYFQGRNLQSMTALVYATLHQHNMKAETMPKKKPARSVPSPERMERMYKLIAFLHTPMRVTREDLTRRNMLEDAG